MTSTDSPSSDRIRIEYDDRTVRHFLIASIFWGLIGMSAGVFVASQLNFWQMNFGLEWLTFGRLRPLHTNAAIFAFVGNMMFAGIYYSTQRLCRCRLASDFLSRLHFWGWQTIIVSAALTLPFGFSRGKEYAELIWPINIAVALIWVVFAINFFWTLAKRNEPTLYVALWFYIATIVTVAMLYIVNHLSLPTSWLHSYPIFGGVQDALVQWWYGHNAVAFFLTTPILGIMYYFIPKAAGRPVYSYRLSIIHFWSLVFVYIWAGPHHLLNTALPSWLQGLGMLFSLMLWAPSWGGMLNGLLTLRGAWHRLRTDPVLKFLAAGVTFYGMSTFEGPLMAIKSVNALSHYSDWTIGHVHGGTLGWNGLMAAGMFYWLAPRLWNTKLHSESMANMHFWIALVGIMLYMGSMWVSGITQGLMLNSVTGDGVLAYPNFLETLQTIQPMYATRLIGGAMYLSGFFMLAHNIGRTIRSGVPLNGAVEVPAPAERENAMASAGAGRISLIGTFINAPTLYTIFGLASCMLWIFGKGGWMIAGAIAAIFIVLCALVHFELSGGGSWSRWYDRLLANAMPFTILTFFAAAIGGAIQIIPTVTLNRARNIEGVIQQVYTPLELAGRDIYIREGCYSCHSQMIRTMVPDVLRYGEFSKLGESIYDHPFQWGSKRTGPDLARVGSKYPDIWHYQHMENPRSTSLGSNMPPYPWLLQKETDLAVLPERIRALRTLGVPFAERTDAQIFDEAKAQAKQISLGLRTSGAYVAPEKEIVALIAYLQQLGKKPQPVPPTP
jgi:cytochrome c oxidase cbb3-type subunit I/II